MNCLRGLVPLLPVLLSLALPGLLVSRARAAPLVAAGEVIISGERVSPTAPGLAAAQAEAQRVPGGASVVAAQDYATGRASNLLDMLAFTPGVFAQPRFGAEEARVSIRGSGLQRTFHMRGINLLQDGLPITLADGSGDFQSIEPLALAYTEVLRGANALQYGGTTLGGSVNFVSPSGHDAAGARPRLELGSFGYRRALLSDGATQGRGDWFVALSAYEQQGFRDWARQRNLRLSGNAGFELRDNLETRFYVGALDSDSRLPGALTHAQLDADAQQANAGSFAGRQKRDYQLYRVANRTVLLLEQARFEAFAGYSYKDLWHPIFQLLQQRSGDYNAGARFVDEHAVAGLASRLTLGITPSWNRVQDDRFVNNAGGKGARTAQGRQRSSNLNLYAQEELGVGAGMTLIGGLQWMESKRRYVDQFLGNGDQSLAAEYRRALPRLGLLWQRSGWQLYGNLSDSFEPPSFGELTGGPGVTPLRAQTARTVELGSRGATMLLRWDVSVYSARVHDELLSLNTPTGQPLGTVNAPRTTHRGVEFTAQLALRPTLTLQSSWLWNDLRFDRNASYGDNALPGVPVQFLRNELMWKPRGAWYVAVNSELSPQRYAIDMAHTLFASSYALFGAKVGRNLDAGWSWFVEARNLGDTVYAATSGVIADARGLDSAQFYPGDRRSVYAGVSWRAH
jgi:iron complex outermembrane receptor protein